MTVTGTAFFGPTGATGPTGPTGGVAHHNIHYLLSRAKIELTGASDAMLRSKFYEVFNEFLSDSSVWQEILVGEIFPNVTDYWLEPQEDPAGVILRLDSVNDSMGFSIPAAMPRPQHMQLQSAPSNEHTVLILVIKTCSIPHENNMPKVPYWIIREYEPYLLAGLLYLMQMQKGRAYSDPALGKMNYYKFRAGVTVARTDAIRRNTFGKNSWLYPQNFRTTTQRGGVSVGSNFREF